MANLVAFQAEQARIALHNCHCLLQGNINYMSPDSLVPPSAEGQFPLIGRIAIQILETYKSLIILERINPDRIEQNQRQFMTILIQNKNALLNKMAALLPPAEAQILLRARV